MAAEDVISALDALEVNKGPEPMTCRFWREASPDTIEAVRRNVDRVGHTLVSKALVAKGMRVTRNGIRDHAAGDCPKCQSQTS